MEKIIDEKKENEGTPENAGEGVQPETNTLVDDTNLAAKRLEEATKEAREERLVREESYSKMKLGGSSEAGQSPVKKEETGEEFVEKVKQGETKLF